MERVDVVELEPLMLDVARACAPVNHDVLHNPKLHVTIGDAREMLLDDDERYDIIVSEPSNPFRAGVASLFTCEYYRAASDAADARRRLRCSGCRRTRSTRGRSAPSTRRWRRCFRRWRRGRRPKAISCCVATARPRGYGAGALRARIAQEPFRTALAKVWRADDIRRRAGALPGHRRGRARPRRLAGVEINTDDRNIVEFGFARSVGRNEELSADEIRRVARVREQYKPALQGPLDWDAVDDEFPAFRLMDGGSVRHFGRPNPERSRRISALSAFAAGDVKGALREWRAQSHEPSGPTELWVVANAYASAGDDGALRYADSLMGEEPVEALLVAGRLRMRQGRAGEAAVHLEEAFARARSFPWSMESAMTSGLALAVDVARAEPKTASGLLDALSVPFAVLAVDDVRKRSAVEIASVSPPGPACVTALEALEPWVPWDEASLERRARCYAGAQHSLAAAAESDLREFRRLAPARFETGLVQEAP